MRVLYDHQIFSSQPQGGVSRYFSELLKGGPDQGVEALTAWRYTSNRYLQTWKPSEFHDWCPSLPFKGKAHLTGFINGLESRQTLSQGSWDVFHPTYFDPYFLPLLRGRPFVLTIHDMTHELYPGGLSDRKILPGRKRLLAGRAAKVITVSENTRQDAIRLLDLDPSRVVAIPHGNALRPSVLKPKAPPVAEGYWLYVGARGAYKNWPRLVEAFALRSCPSDRLVMVGGGALNEEEQRILTQGGLLEKAFQTSATDEELAGWYSRARALVYPSLYEGFGMTILEAMAWGCPVVAARASCFPEIGGEAALYFEPDSSESLAAALGQMEDEGLRGALVARGLEREQGFNWARSVAQTAAVYRGVL